MGEQREIRREQWARSWWCSRNRRVVFGINYLLFVIVKLDIYISKYKLPARSRSSEEPQIDDSQRTSESVEIDFYPFHILTIYRSAINSFKWDVESEDEVDALGLDSEEGHQDLDFVWRGMSEFWHHLMAPENDCGGRMFSLVTRDHCDTLHLKGTSWIVMC